MVEHALFNKDLFNILFLLTAEIISEGVKIILKSLLLARRQTLMKTEYCKTEKTWENVINLILSSLVARARPKIC